MYLCEFEYLAWHGKSDSIRMYRVLKNNPSKNYFIRGGNIIPHKRNKKLKKGTSILKRYAKIGNKMNWIYPH